MATESGITRNQILSSLSKSPHGKLEEYVAEGVKAANQEPEFLAHLISWNHIKGEIRDSKVALPVVSLMGKNFSILPELAENSFAHLALLGPREILRAYKFALASSPRPAGMRRFKTLIQSYLKEIELDRQDWNRVAVQHRATLKALYGMSHTQPAGGPGGFIDQVIMKGINPPSSVFEVISQLGKMSVEEAAQEITVHRIPFIIATGALGKKAKDPVLVQALIERMSPTELVTNTKLLGKLGVTTNPALRASFEAGLKKASQSKKNVLKTTRAAEAIEDEGLKEKLQGLQDRQLQSMGVEGNWLVLGDKSGSMAHAIELARHVASVLAKMVKGKVWLTFFNTSPQTIDVTGASLDIIKKATQYIRADGGTSIGCGLQRMLDEKQEVDGIVIVSDGDENTSPYFHQVYPKYASWAGKEPTVYLYHCGSKHAGLSRFMASAGIDLQVFDLAGSTDYYSLPNLVSTMRVSRYGLLEEVLDAPLRTVSEVLKRVSKEVGQVKSKGKEVQHA